MTRLQSYAVCSSASAARSRSRRKLCASRWAERRARGRVSAPHSRTQAHAALQLLSSSRLARNGSARRARSATRKAATATLRLVMRRGRAQVPARPRVGLTALGTVALTEVVGAVAAVAWGGAVMVAASDAAAAVAVAVAVSATELAIGAETVAAVGVGLLVAASSAAKNAAGLVNATVEGEVGHARGRWMTVQSGRGHGRGHVGDEILM